MPTSFLDNAPTQKGAQGGVWQQANVASFFLLLLSLLLLLFSLYTQH